MTVVRALAVPADPLAIARALRELPGLAVVASCPAGAPDPADAAVSFVACEPVEASEALVPGAGSDPYGEEEGDGGGRPPDAPAWIGVVPYDALRDQERPEWTRLPDERPAPLLCRPAWRRYAAVVRIEHATGRVCVVGDDARSVERLARRVTRGQGSPRSGRPFGLDVLPAAEPDEAHLARVRQALALIAAGDLYEVNVARRIAVALRGDALSLFTRLVGVAPAPWGFLQDLGETLALATSPELALSVRGAALRTCPIKGTRPRATDAATDAALASELDADPKERAELTMAVDVHRSDLGRVAVPGSVQVRGEPRVLGGATVWSRVAEIVATRRPGVTLEDVARAVLPCGSVTGAPKVRAMEVIARLEPWRRGLYTGAMGYVGRGGRLELAVAIRALQLRKGAGAAAEGDYFAGGGIVADSVPERELEETRWKAVQLGRL